MHCITNATLAAVECRLGVEFRTRGHLAEALTHRSHRNECRACTRHNERLEFLGDAILEFVVSEYLFNRHPEATEGELTNLRAALVRTETLTMVGRSLSLEDVLLFSRGEQQDPSGGRARQYQIACAVEAILGAIYRDRGIGECRMFIDAHILSHASAFVSAADDPKGALQELAQKRVHITPHYEVVAESGPDHEKRFRVAAYVGRIRLSIGEGASKLDAEKVAARAALETQPVWLHAQHAAGHHTTHEE